MFSVCVCTFADRKYTFLVLQMYICGTKNIDFTEARKGCEWGARKWIPRLWLFDPCIGQVSEAVHHLDDFGATEEEAAEAVVVEVGFAVVSDGLRVLRFLACTLYVP